MKTSIILTLLHYVCIIYYLLQFVHASLYFTFQYDPPKLCILSETCFETCTSLSEHISRFTINNLKTMVYFQLLWSHTLPIFFFFFFSLFSFSPWYPKKHIVRKIVGNLKNDWTRRNRWKIVRQKIKRKK